MYTSVTVLNNSLSRNSEVLLQVKIPEAGASWSLLPILFFYLIFQNYILSIHHVENTNNPKYFLALSTPSRL